ncbi:hypothetical protein DNTS_017499 [Danionella cerebrum]|uniref:Mandelate racemase/muconate lactonizing enzyme C-terminal domain-containing protein n=1 Tax=Danionella cerebrum TaxID=2873325 RepID=A0A553R8D0_9TELE|nr:hypothetical protein DNTS_017499 [Danionella translucida]
MLGSKIIKVSVQDVRFPTSLEQHGSDAMHTDPDYSVAYVVLETDNATLKGYGLTFTVGRGTEIVVCAVKALSSLVEGKTLEEIIGPEKGVIHLATAAILNAVWDLWARVENKPLWKLLVDMEPEKLISCIDFRYISDALTEQEALDILMKAKTDQKSREEQMLKEGYPAYTTSCAWLGYSDQQLTQMIDANQRWDVNEAITWVTKLAEFRPLWIEEPTCPDDILGHASISKGLAQFGIGVASGEQCHNRVMFKQFLQASALQFIQIDSCRVGSVNENLAILLMAAKFNVPVCPHAGGVGLCELVQHLILFDYICVSASLSNRTLDTLVKCWKSLCGSISFLKVTSGELLSRSMIYKCHRNPSEGILMFSVERE